MNRSEKWKRRRGAHRTLERSPESQSPSSDRREKVLERGFMSGLGGYINSLDGRISTFRERPKVQGLDRTVALKKGIHEEKDSTSRVAFGRTYGVFPS